MPADPNAACSTCRAPRATTDCALCSEPLCRRCVILPAGDAFALDPQAAPELKLPRYCQRCHDDRVAAPLAAYEETLALARDVIYLPKTYKMQVQVLKKAKNEVRVEACADRDETILRLAFLAARDGYNALIQAEVERRKVRNHAYQTSEWSGHGFPATLDVERLNRAEYLEEVWRRGH